MSSQEKIKRQDQQGKKERSIRPFVHIIYLFTNFFKFPLKQQYAQTTLLLIYYLGQVAMWVPARNLDGENLNFKGYEKKKMDPSQIFAQGT